MKTLNTYFRIIFFLLAAGWFLVACHPKDSSTPTPNTNASSYSFTDANYKKQTVVLLQIDSLLSVVGSEDNGNSPIDSSSLASIYTTDLFSDVDTGVTLNSLIYSGGVVFTDFQVRAYFDSIAKRSKNPNFLGETGSDSAVTISGGLYLPEYYEKCFMGALIYYQANHIFATISTADNSTIDSKYGTTDMIHQWDELFGYMGMPVDYPSWTYAQLDAGTKDLSDPDTADFKNHETDFLFGEYIGRSTFEYTVFTSSPTNYVQNIFNAFVTGRNAISNKDYTTRDAQLAIIKDIWERIIVTNAISYAYKCLAIYPPASNVYGQHWTEMYGFVHMLQYNSSSKVYGNLQQVYAYVGNKPTDPSSTDLNNLITYLKTTYGY